MTSRTTARFWKCYRQLPVEVRNLARKNFRLWRDDPQHSFIALQASGKGQWSVRIGIHCRATGRFSGANEFTWDWIGTHGQYDRLA